MAKIHLEDENKKQIVNKTSLKNKNTKKLNINYRKLIIFLLFLVIFPLGVIAIVGASYASEANTFKIKISDVEHTYKKSEFKNYDIIKGQFKNLQLNHLKHYTIYNDSKDKEQKHNPIGYANDFDILIDLEESNVYDKTKDAQIIGLSIFPGSDGPKDTDGKKYKEEKTVYTSRHEGKAEFRRYGDLKILKKLPFRYPFVLPIKNEIYYFIIRVPFLKQPQLEELIRKNPNASDSDKKKATEYKEFKFYYNFNKSASFNKAKNHFTNNDDIVK